MKGFKLSSLLTICLCVLNQNLKAASRIDPLVETNVGLIRGLRSSDGNYSMFMGIPYARVDEANPFGASIPHPEFDQVFEAFDDSAICPQVEDSSNTVIGNLDCLHLNIYVPNTATSRNRLPVLVWIYGGGFVVGFSGRYLYGPSFLIRHDIILVTLNYRVGPYGFMCLDTPEVPGNQGLKDQLLALKWIRHHIESFGGDADKITIFGESAGGNSVDMHIHYNQEKLFNQAIMQSGNAMGPRAIVESDRSVPLKIAGYLGFSTNEVKEALSFLSTVDTRLVIAASSELRLSHRICVEKDFDGVEAIVTEHSLNIKIPRVADTAILIGHNNDENYHGVITPLGNNIHDYLIAYFNFDEKQLFEMETLVNHFYIGNKDTFSAEYIQALSNYVSDFMYNYPAQRSIARYLENKAKAIYQYMFSYNGGRNYLKQLSNITVGGAAHADEIGYLFDISYMKDKPSAEDQLIIDRITTLWANFVKFGNPTPEVSDLLPVTWTPVTEDKRFYLNIDSELSLECRQFHDRMAFWDLFYTYNKQFQKGYSDDI